MSDSERKIYATNYFEKNVNGSNIAGRDINIQNNQQGMTKEEFLQLLQTFKQDLVTSGLPEETIEEVTDDLEKVEKQMQKDEPNQSIVSRKLDGINGLLEDANNASETIEKGSETLAKIIQTGQTLANGLSLFF